MADAGAILSTPSTSGACPCSRRGTSPRPRCRSPRPLDWRPRRARFGRRSAAPTSAAGDTPRRRVSSRPSWSATRSNDFAHFCLGRALTLTGQRDRARRHLAIAANLRPERDDYRIYRQRLPAVGSRSHCMRALVQRVSRASVSVEGRRASSVIGPGLLVLLGVRPRTTEAEADRLADKVRALRIFDDADGQDERAARRTRGALREPVHPLRGHPQGQPAELHARGAAGAGRAAVRALLRAAGRKPRRVRRPDGGRAGQRRARDADAGG